MSYDDLINSTVHITCGESSGSGFFLESVNTIVTNQHVVSSGQAAYADFAGTHLPLRLLAESPANQEDFALYEVVGSAPSSARALKAKIYDPFQIGTDVAFAGFPHGIPHLLVQQAIISGLVNDNVFYLDGSINGGNSGGPIIDITDGSVIGIVTQRRFLGGHNFEGLSIEAEQLRQHCERMAGHGSVQIMGSILTSLGG